MTVYLIGDHQEILHSLIQDTSTPEIRIIPHALFEVKCMGETPLEDELLFVFDLNNPIKAFEQSLDWIQNHFSSAPIWAIFDSKSLSLREEILRLGFFKIISYQDDLLKLLEEADMT